MPPKKTAAAGATKTKSAAPPAHASYQDMIKEAIINLKERNGSSRQAIKKYVQANNNLSNSTENQFTAQFNKALAKGGDAGVFARPKGPSGPVKLAKPADKATTKTETATTKTKAPAKARATKAAAAEKPEKAEKAEKTEKAEKAEKAEKKPAAKKVTKTTTTKKAPAAKKTTTKTTKTTANTGKARKTAKAPTSAPAVEEQTTVVLGKTKSGRVTKSNAPQPVTKAIAPKKAAVKKTTSKKVKA